MGFHEVLSDKLDDGKTSVIDTQVLTTTKGQDNLPRFFESTFRVVQRLRRGRLDICLPDGRIFRAEGPEPGPVGRLDVSNTDVFARAVREGDLGVPEAYMDGWWDTPDLQALLDVMMANTVEVIRGMPGMSFVRMYERMRFWLQSNSKSQAKRNISYHYDLGNDFYGLWLDDTMTYSSALFTDWQESLETAQTRKYASMCDRIGVQPGDHILEIGCGWGGFAEYAARERGAHVTGLTISQQQHDYARERIARAGLSDRDTIEMMSYRNTSSRGACGPATASSGPKLRMRASGSTEPSNSGSATPRPCAAGTSGATRSGSGLRRWASTTGSSGCGTFT